MEEKKNYYEILGVNEAASIKEIRQAFCQLTKKLHPDTTSLNKEVAETQLQFVLEAYENLSNSVLRHFYDKKLRRDFFLKKGSK